MTKMIIGLDPHKSSNTIAVIDRDEELKTRRRFDNTDDGLVDMLAAVAEFDDRVWAVEGANGIGRSIAQRLVAAGENVIDVPAKLATRVRVYSTGHGNKTDQADAYAIARAALHSKNLRAVTLDDDRVALKLPSDRRHELVGARTQSVCRLHRLIRELVPGGTPRSLNVERAEALLNGVEVTDPAGMMRVELAWDHVDDLRRVDAKIDTITLKIHTAVKASGSTVIRIYGVGVVNAGLVLGEVGDNNRHRLSRSGNRRLNHAIHIAAVTQVHRDTPGRTYCFRKIAEGKTKREAIRCVKRPPETGQTRHGPTSRSGSGCGLTEASAPGER